MKAQKRDKPATNEPLEERFNRFAKALMAVPKKELDKELAKHKYKKHQSRNGKKSTP